MGPEFDSDTPGTYTALHLLSSVRTFVLRWFDFFLRPRVF